MDKKWLDKLASKVEDRHGQAVRDNIFGDIPTLPLDSHRDREWIHRFVTGIHNLNDVDYVKFVEAEYSTV